MSTATFFAVSFPPPTAKPKLISSHQFCGVTRRPPATLKPFLPTFRDPLRLLPPNAAKPCTPGPRYRTCFATQPRCADLLVQELAAQSPSHAAHKVAPLV